MKYSTLSTKNFTLLVFTLLFNSFVGNCQCPVTATASSTTIKCGDPVTLSAVAFGCRPLQNNFNDGTLGSSWKGTQGAKVVTGQETTPNYSCFGLPPEGSYYMFMGDDVQATPTNPRKLETISYDLKQCGSNSGYLSFLMKYSTQAFASPCEGPDNLQADNEGVNVQYSLDNGTTWTTIQYYATGDGTLASLTKWTRYNLNIPAAALTPNTSFRWAQFNSSSANGSFKYDTWGLDDVSIVLNVPGYTFDWAHDVQGPAATPATPVVTPSTTTSYTVTYTNGVAPPCTSTITVNVINPTVTATATKIAICPGENSQLDTIIGNTDFKPTTCGINTAGCIGATSIINVGSGTTTSGLPFDGAMAAASRIQMLYLKSEMAAGTTAGQINSIAFFATIPNGANNKVFQNCNVKIGCTNIASFGTGSIVPITNLVPIASNKTVTIVAGWNTINFDQAYNWDGNSNLVIDLCWTNNGTSSPTPVFSYTATAFSSTYYNSSLFGNTNLCSDVTSLASGKNRPNIQLGYCNSIIDTSSWVYSWSPTTGLSNPNIKNPVASPTTTTNYTVSFQNPSNTSCKATSNINITVTVTPPPIAIHGAKCGTDSVDLSVTGCSGTVNWYTAPTGGTPIFTGTNFTTPTIAVTTTYYASCSTANCESVRIPVIATINAGVTPTFDAIPPICSGDVAPILPTNSNNIPPIIGTWSGPVDNTSSGTYTFTPNTGQCANTTILPVTVNPKIATTISCGTSTTTTVQFDWTTVLDATNYDISYQVGTNPIVTIGPVGNILTYTITGLMPSDTVTITVLPKNSTNGCYLPTTLNCTTTSCVPSSASINYATPFCSNNTSSQAVVLTGSGNYLGGTFTATGGLSINGLTGAITPNISGNYSINYTVIGIGGCPSVIANTTIVVTELPSASISYAGSPFCNNNATPQNVTITGSGEYTGGTYSSTSGLIINSTTGVITANGSIPGNYTVTYLIPSSNGCPSVPVTTTVIVTQAQTVTISYGTPFCSNNGNPQNVTIAGSGAYTGGTYSSTSGLSINASTGEITPINSIAGTYTVTYTAPGTGGCASIIATTTVVITELPSASISYAGSPFCNNIATPQNVTITGSGEYTGGTYSSTSGLIINSTTGVITTNGSVPGNYTVTYLIPSSNGCPSVPVTTTVIVTQAPIVTISYGTPFCSNNGNPQNVTIAGSGAYTGGTYSSTSGLSINASTGEITPINSIAGTYTVTYTAPGTGGCASIIATTTVVITELPSASISYAGSPFCNNNATPQNVTITGSGEYTGGIYSSTSGLIINSTTGVITANGSIPGNYTVTYLIPASNGCPSVPVTTVVTVTDAPTATISYLSPFCISNRIPQNVAISGTGAFTGGEFGSSMGLSINSITGSILPNSSVAGTYTVTYTIPASGGCSIQTTSTIVTINELPIVSATPDSQTICSGESTGIALTSSINGTIFSWTVSQIGVTGGSDGSGSDIIQTLVNNGTGTGTATYTITPFANGCTGNLIVVTIMVNQTPIATATPATHTICSGQTTGIVISSNIPNTTYTWTYAQSGVTGASSGSGNNISQVLFANSTELGIVMYTITPVVNSCVGTPIAVTVIVTPPPSVIATPNIQTICSESTTNIALTGNIPGTIFTWNVIQSNVTGASAGSGNFIQQTLQTITTNPGQAVFEVTPIMNGCPGIPTMVVVNVNPKPILFVNPTQETICSGSTTNINLSSNLAATTYSWSTIQTGVFGAASGTGNIIAQTLTTVDTIEGTVDYIITPITNGCPGLPKTVRVIVKPTPEVFGAPVATICSGESPNISLFPSIVGTTFSWTALAVGVTGAGNGSGDVINQNLETIGNIMGTVIYTITPTANNCVGKSINIEIKVNPLPLPDLTDGIICIDKETGNSTSTYTLETGLSSSSYSFEWFYNNGTTPISGAFENTYEAFESGIYTVVVTNLITGCISKLESATVTESYPGTDFSVITSAPFSNNPAITVNVFPENPNYRYSLDDGTPQESNVFNPVALGIHTVHVSDSNNCTDKTITVFVIGYPHYYTPNGDGINDTWNVVGVNDPNAKLYIFDRYGKFLKQISPIGEGWDGNYNGEKLPSTDYWFTIEYSDTLLGNQNVFKSHFSLKR